MLSRPLQRTVLTRASSDVPTRSILFVSVIPTRVDFGELYEIGSWKFPIQRPGRKPFGIKGAGMEAHATCHVCYHRGFVRLCVLGSFPSQPRIERNNDHEYKTQCFCSTIHKRVSIMSAQGLCDPPRSLISPKSLRPFPTFHPSHLSFVHRSLFRP